MTSTGMRASALAAVALVAIAVAIALGHRSHKHAPLPAAAGPWYSALAAPYTSSKSRTKSACGVVVGAKTVGVVNQVLPCGVKLYIQYQGRQALAQVVDRGHTVPGRQFDLTQELAALLHMEGTQTIQWRFAR